MTSFSSPTSVSNVIVLATNRFVCSASAVERIRSVLTPLANRKLAKDPVVTSVAPEPLEIVMYRTSLELTRET